MTDIEKAATNLERESREPPQQPYHSPRGSVIRERPPLQLRMVLIVTTVLLVLGLGIMLYLMGERRWG